MDAHLFRLLCERLEPLLTGARIEKIQEFAQDHLGLSLYGSIGKFNLYLRFGKRQPFAFTSSAKVSALPKPSAAVMRLRKHFSGRRIAAVISQVWSRKIWLMAATDNKPAWLCLDLARGASIHFLQDSELPEPEDVQWPEPGSENNWQAWPVLTPRLRHTLSRLDEPEQAALLADLEAGNGDIFLYRDQTGRISQISAWPLPENSELREEASSDILASFEQAGRELVLQNLFDARMGEEAAAINRRQKQLGKILAKLELDEAKLLRMTAREADALALSENLWRLDPAARQSSIELEAGHRIALDGRFTLRENIERLFHAAKRGKRGLLALAERRKVIENELNNLEAGALQKRQAGQKQVAPVQIKAPAHCQGFLSSDGFVLLRGKDAKGNQALRRFASGHDIWIHVEQGAGAHVLIRSPYAGYAIPERTLTEAGTLAANKSWLSRAASGTVMYAESRHVKPCRSGPPGKVTIDRIIATRVVPVDHSLEERLEKAAMQASKQALT